MTIQVNDQAGNHITEAMNVAALADNSQFAAQTIDNAYSAIVKYNSDVVIVTTGSPVAFIGLQCLRFE